MEIILLAKANFMAKVQVKNVFPRNFPTIQPFILYIAASQSFTKQVKDEKRATEFANLGVKRIVI